ncbi:hypothetical protein [Chitinophaga cymbidii]|uniref:Lipoprotein n=1 Tax=Chitinophaga cymbidii TaxID=1096750 RepID=A0A512RNN2_9BACT|nr:hypothetical protein [Chitinophaga cymbidii]GEP97308.1 hypothetical protein CCY01nite_35680 [Chitinophaga cymbidii]
MRRFLFLPLLLAFFSCKKDNSFPRTETITKGEKWGMQIGSTAADVYLQLQQLGQQKENLGQVEVTGQLSTLFNQPDEIGPRMALYSGISIEKQQATYPDRVIISFYGDKISNIDEGSGLTAPVTQWPQNAPEEIALRRDENLGGIYNKLQAIYTTGVLEGYAIRLGQKSLGKPFDPVMADHDQWRFVFNESVSAGVDGRYTVTLHFKNGRLERIYIEYSEFEVMN